MTKTIQWIISIVCGAVATFFNAYGAMLGFMATAIILDLITGLIKAGKAGTISSKVSKQGIRGKALYFVTFFFCVLLDVFIPYMLQYISVTLPFNLPFTLIITIYIVLNECISIAENINEVNPNLLPSWVIPLLKVGKKKIDNTEK